MIFSQGDFIISILVKKMVMSKFQKISRKLSTLSASPGMRYAEGISVKNATESPQNLYDIDENKFLFCNYYHANLWLKFG